MADTHQAEIQKLREAYSMGKQFVTEYSSRPPTSLAETTKPSAGHKHVASSSPVQEVGNRSFSSAVPNNPAEMAKDRPACASKPGRLSLHYADAKSKLFKMARKTDPSECKLESGKDSGVLQKEALEFMIGVMDECTHLGNFSVPFDPELVIIILAEQDAYVPRTNVLRLDELWPGSEVRYISRGHVAAFLFNQYVFRKAIIDGFNRQIDKYYS